MKRYISLAGALLIGTVVANEKKQTYKTATAVAAKKTAVVETHVQELVKAVPVHGHKRPIYESVHTNSDKDGVEDSKTSAPGEVDSVTTKNSPFAKAPVTSVTTIKDEVTSNRTVTTPSRRSPHARKAATSVTT